VFLVPITWGFVTCTTVVHGGTRWYTVVHGGTRWYRLYHGGTALDAVFGGVDGCFMAIDTLAGVYVELFDTVGYESDATGALAFRRVQAIRQLIVFSPREVENGDQRIRFDGDYWMREQAKVEAFYAGATASGSRVTYPQFYNWGAR